MDVFFDDTYCGAGHAFDTTRKAALLATNLCEHPIEGIALRSPTPATCVDLERIHHPDYVAALLSGVPEGLAWSSGLGWDSGHVAAVLASTGGCIDAARSAWRDGIAGTLSSGLHHARTSTGAGYCTVNGLALAALTFLDLGAPRVLIVDLDAHCGGGTADIAGSDERISAVDISTSAFDYYDHTEKWSLDVVHHGEDYLAMVRRRLAEVPDGSFDAVVYNAGMDSHEDCSVGGIDGITDEILAERERMVFEFAANAPAPIMFALAGGYSSADMGTDHLTALHRLTVEAAARAAQTRAVAP